jgi:hypothetical protein
MTSPSETLRRNSMTTTKSKTSTIAVIPMAVGRWWPAFYSLSWAVCWWLARYSNDSIFMTSRPSKTTRTLLLKCQRSSFKREAPSSWVRAAMTKETSVGILIDLSLSEYLCHDHIYHWLIIRIKFIYFCKIWLSFKPPPLHLWFKDCLKWIMVAAYELWHGDGAAEIQLQSFPYVASVHV